MSLLSWIYGDDENARRAAEAEAKHRELNEARTGSSRMIQDDLAGQSGVEVWVPPAEQEKQIDGAFVEGWNDGKKNVTGFISGTFKVIGDVISSVLLGIPIWAWIVAAVALWGWLGFPGLNAIRKKLA